MNLPVTVAVLLEHNMKEIQFPGRLSWFQMALALHTKVKRTECLLVRGGVTPHSDTH